MARILIADTYYPAFLKSWRFNPAATYESELSSLLEFSFGTFDGYSRNLAALGWEARDVIVNCPELESRYSFADQIRDFQPDVIFLQDLSIKLPRTDALIAGQCSCPMPSEDNLRKCDVIFSSFPHYIDRFERMGIKAVFNPLAFDPIVLDRIDPKCSDRVSGIQSTHATDTMSVDAPDRIHDCVFVGGVGNPSHWRGGMETLEAIAREIPTFKWWGYGAETLSACSALPAKYQGEAWGLDMYRILLQSKIVINRHGEVAHGYANNMRMFEATGCGALLMTERAPNLHDYFNGTEVVAYGSPEEAVYSIRRLLDNGMARNAVARNGQARTLKDHTYAQRMKTISDTLTAMLARAVSVI